MNWFSKGVTDCQGGVDSQWHSKNNAKVAESDRPHNELPQTQRQGTAFFR